jgi:hypothetical protein
MVLHEQQLRKVFMVGRGQRKEDVAVCVLSH